LLKDLAAADIASWAEINNDQSEHSTKFHGWELSAKRDEKTGQIVSTVAMPEFPGLDKVLDAAEKMYAFVNSGTKK
jgi:hypothetical protein